MDATFAYANRTLPMSSRSPQILLFGLMILAPCMLWQLFWMKQSLLEGYDFPLEDFRQSSYYNQPQLETTTHVKNHDTASTLLNLSMIRSTLLKEAPWAESHGADHNVFLGGALLYYAYAYAFQTQTIVVLGSGGGFVPRILKQAQRDLEASGRPGPFNLYLVDAHLPQAGWGSTFYADNMDTIMRKNFNDIHYIFNLTNDAYNILKEKNLKIDYLHVDADHGFEQSWKDFDNFSNLLAHRAVVSFHDTCRDHNRECHVTGVPQTMDKLRSELTGRGLQMMDAHYLYRGLAFAIRQDAPPLETPENRRINFCRNNAASLDKISPGFTLNGNVGQLPTLGDFFECHKYFNMADLIEDYTCPYGKRRHPIKGHCNDCIPGMKGNDCRTFQYQTVRRKAAYAKLQNEKLSNFRKEENNDAAKLAASWLATEAQRERRSQHIIEIGPSASRNPALRRSEEELIAVFDNEKALAVSNLLHDVHDIIAVDPLLIHDPVWSVDRNERYSPQIERKRFLPIAMKDVVNEHKELLPLDKMDTFVCLICNDLLVMLYERKRDPEKNSQLTFSEYLESKFPSIQTMVLGVKSVDSSQPSSDAVTFNAALDAMMDGFVPNHAWEVKSDVILISRGGQNQRRHEHRLVLVSKNSN
jgi:hypothetical protein